MENDKICRICFMVMDVKMYNLQKHPFNIYFEPVTGCKLLPISKSLPYACFECASLIRKFYLFKQKCVRSQNLLYGFSDDSGKVNLSNVRQLDRQALELSSNLKQSSLSSVTILNISIDDTESKALVKLEDTEETQTNMAVDDEFIKEEDNYGLLSDRDMSSDDDDEPLSLHKEKKIKEIEFNMDSNDKDGKLIPLENGIELCTKQVKIRKKRGRPKKLKAPKKVVVEAKEKTYSGTLIESLPLIGDYITVINLSIEEQLEEILKRKTSSNYLNSPYQCNLCYKGFIDTHAWKHHVNKHSANAGNVECKICKFRFKTKRALQKHASNHEKKYACKSCPYVSSNTTQAKQHQGWHKGVTYKCKFCDNVFTRWTSYMSHVRIKHPSEFICGICGYSFVSKLGLSMHKSMMHKDILEKGEDATDDGPYCEECDVKFISMEAYKRHTVMSTKHTRATKINGCRTCGQTFKNSEDLRLHNRTEHAKKRPKNYGKKPSNMNFPAKCEHCSEEILNGRDHWSHYRRMHPDKAYPIQKNYVCDVCGKSFRGNAFLVYHKRTHQEEKAYKCAVCGKSFYNRTNMLVHVRTHSDTRPHACTVCCKAFKSKGALNRHFRSHTGQKPYECEVCGKAFSQSNSRKLHVTTVHLKQPAPYVSKRRKNTGKEIPHQQFIY